MKNSRPSFEKSKHFGQRLEQLVPGGAHTYSKGRDQFPLESPNGIVSGKGARVVDADGNGFIDWSMGLTSVSLGHAYDPVDETVITSLRRGVNFQRPSDLELQAAEAFLAMTGTDMVKFAKHGSVVLTAAVKLARGYTGRARVAVPREHPFFSFDDWFIGTTAADFGIPDALKQFTLQFNYNDAASLDALFRAYPGDIAAVVLEPVKFDPPQNGFLEAVRELCDRNGTVLVLDEMITGLKLGVPGASWKLGVKADIYTFGKGIANGFSAAALTGRQEIMRMGGLEPEGARKLFLLSTTHGAESTGLAAMVKTLELFADGAIVAENYRKGAALRARLDAVTDRYGLGSHISITGYDPLMLATFKGPDGKSDDFFRTLFLQEMIAAGVLFQGLLVLTPSHGDSELHTTEAAWDRACSTYRTAMEAGSTGGLLLGPPIKPVFRRYL